MRLRPFRFRTGGGLAAVCFSLTTHLCFAYEIGNHADITQRALEISKLKTDSGKLARLGLRQLDVASPLQVFPRAASGAEIPVCYSTPPLAPEKYQILQLFRHGACYEDDIENGVRVFSHFYDPKNGGIGLSPPALPQQPPSYTWALSGTGATAQTGVNHFSYQDARNSFYKAVTDSSRAERNRQWGLTFQSLGHVMHHLQDMAQPQHVRQDSHCDSALCFAAGQYNPSSYEKLMITPTFVQIVRALAQTATTPILFGLPKEFWNATGTENLNTYGSSSQGIAAYSSTNFVSAGTDFRISTAGGAVQAPGHNYPIPTSVPTEVTDIGALTGYTNADAPFRLKTVCPDLAKCRVEFWGSTNQPNTRKSSTSIFGQDLKVVGATVVGYPNQFSQNAFTHAATASDLVPLTTRYSAGLIDYFFRGEMQVRTPAEGIYGLIDGGDPASNCKDACGFKKIKLRVTNTTQPINGTPQNFTGGAITAVVKFSRNTCFTSDFASDPGSLYPLNASCFAYANGEPVEEQVMADPLPLSFSLAAGAEASLTFNFTSPIPINAWNVKLQVVYRGQIGQESDGVAVHTLRLSTPTPLRYTNEYDYLLVNQRLYTRAEVNANQTLLGQVVPASCVTGAAASRTLVASCFNPQTISTSWNGANGATLASLTALPTNSHALFVYLADYFGTVNASLPGPNGTSVAVALDVRDIIARNSDNALVSDLMLAWRNLQAWRVYSRYYLASVDQTPPTLAVSNQRPAFPTTTPVKLTSVNF